MAKTFEIRGTIGLDQSNISKVIRNIGKQTNAFKIGKEENSQITLVCRRVSLGTVIAGVAMVSEAVSGNWIWTAVDASVLERRKDFLNITMIDQGPSGTDLIFQGRRTESIAKSILQSLTLAESDNNLIARQSKIPKILPTSGTDVQHLAKKASNLGSNVVKKVRNRTFE